MNNSICTLFDNILIDIHKFKSLLYHIGLYGFRKLIAYVIKDNGDNISIVSLNKDGSFPNTFGTVICIT